MSKSELEDCIFNSEITDEKIVSTIKVFKMWEKSRSR